MIITAEYDLDLDRIADRVGDEIERIITEEENINWDYLTDASRKDLYKNIANRILKWT